MIIKKKRSCYFCGCCNRKGMDPLTTPWWLTVGFASLILSISQLGPFWIVMLILMMGGLYISPVASTIEWFNKVVSVTPGKAIGALLALFSLPLLGSFLVGLTGETEEPPAKFISNGLVIAVAAVGGIILSSVLPKFGSSYLVSTILLLFVSVGVHLGSVAHANLKGNPDLNINGVKILIAFAVLFVVLLTSTVKGQITSKVSEKTMDFMSQNSMPMLS
jgi:hypothetical protein